MVGLGCYLYGKKRAAAGSRSPVALTAISLKEEKVLPYPYPYPHPCPYPYPYPYPYP